MRRKLLRQEPLIDEKEGIETGIIRQHRIHYEAVPPTCNVYKVSLYNSFVVYRGGGVRG